MNFEEKELLQWWIDKDPLTSNEKKLIHSNRPNYLIQNNKLPCPAGLKKSTGIALNNCATTDATNGVFVSNSVARGWVPYETLNISPDNVYLRYEIMFSKSCSAVSETSTIYFFIVPTPIFYKLSIL